MLISSLKKRFSQTAALAVLFGISSLLPAEAASLTSRIPGCEFTLTTRRNPGTGIIPFARTCTTDGIPLSISGELLTSVQSYTRTADGRLELGQTGGQTVLLFQLSKFSITNNSTTQTLKLFNDFLYWENQFNVTWASGGGTTYTRFRGSLNPAPSASTRSRSRLFFESSYDNDNILSNGNITSHGLQAFRYDSGGVFDPILNDFDPNLDPVPTDLSTNKEIASGNLIRFPQNGIFSADGALSDLILEPGRSYILPASGDMFGSSDPSLTLAEAEELTRLVVAAERGADPDPTTVPEPASGTGLLAIGGFLASLIVRRRR